MNQTDIAELEAGIDKMMEIARGFGLDFYPMRFEVCPADVIYTFGAYGMPTRYNHWSFGKAFHRMKLEYDLGLSRIYELVVNSDPCYAFLLDGNSLLQNKTVSAHVLAHCDFFKNNVWFSRTSRDMVDRMASNANRIHAYELEYGRKRVEQVLDAGMALQEHIDGSAMAARARTKRDKEERRRPPQLTPKSPYDDLWALDGQTGPEPNSEQTRIPRTPQKDILLFLIEHSTVLEEWERDILSVLREEMMYFWPQLETKIMNEGWATYWHLRIMRELDMDEADTIDFAKMHAGVVMPSRTSINPYHLGLAIWEDIEKRWDNPAEEDRKRFGQPAGQGRAKMFEVREIENDISFLRNYLTKELVDELDLYLYQKVGSDWRVVEKDWEKVRDQICSSRVNGGVPVLSVTDGDYNHNGELYVRHAYEGMELDLKHLEKTLPYMQQLWGRNCHLQTMIESRDVVFTCDGKRTQRRFL